MRHTLRPTFPLLLALFLILTGCEVDIDDGDGFDADDARMEIEAANQRFETYIAAQQWDSLMTLYTSDAMMMPQGAPLAEGNAIRDGFMQMGRAGIRGIQLETMDVEADAETAYEVGRYMLEGPNGMTVDQGKYLVVWKHEDGEWKLHRDMFNSDTPAPGAGGLPSDTTMTDTTLVDPTLSDTAMADTADVL